MHTTSDEAFERSNSRRFYLCVILGIIVSQCWPWEKILERLAVAVAGLIAGFVVASVLEWFAVALHRCPQCGTRIGAPLGTLGKEVILRCTECDIDWDLGIRQSNSADNDDRNNWLDP